MSNYFQKYCPTDFNEIVHNRKVCKTLFNISKTSDIPHIAICGQKGTGKRTMVRAFLKEIYGRGIYELKYNNVTRKYNNRKIDLLVGYSHYHFEINPSKHSVYDKLVTQDFVKEVSKYQNMVENDGIEHNTIVMHDADKLTIEAQQSLRSTLEHNIISCRFIFIVSNIENLIDPLQSRCIMLRTSVLNKSEMSQIMNNIIENENSSTNTEQLNDIIDHSENDLTYGMSLLYVKLCEEKGIQISERIVYDSLFVFEEHTNRVLNFIIELHTGKVKLMTEKKVVEKFRNLLYNMLLVIEETSQFIEMFIDKLFKYINQCDESMLKKTRVTHLRNIVRYGLKYEETMLAGSKEIYHLEAFVLNVICELLGLNNTESNGCLRC
jgi:replication factor C subunit 3/5